MGDSESGVAQTSAVADYSSADYNNRNVTAASDTGVSVVQVTEKTAGPASVSDTEDIVASSGTSNKADSVAHGSEMDTVTGYDSSVNGIGVNEAVDVAIVNIMQNGVTSTDGIGSPVLRQPLGALSAEEERLWNIVTANSLDFNAWTSLIEETERTPEVDILKIQKVYDTFLAEFPLCYGYWKKYADHVARLCSMDKVAEVYERAVQSVTYSVDMWLHYCVFAIGTYGDPESIRSICNSYF